MNSLVRTLLGGAVVPVAACGCPTVPDDLSPADYIVDAGSSAGAGGGDGGEGGEGGGDISRCEALCEGSTAWAKLRDAGFFDGEIVVGGCSDLGDGTVQCSIGTDCSAGRRAAGHASTKSPCSNARDHWRAMAELERSAVLAFEELAATLRHHGAPDELVLRSLAAAEDERRHTAAALRLCESTNGTEPVEVRGASLAQRGDASLLGEQAAKPLSLVELAQLNAREGCVLESFAAIQVAWQARTVADPGLAATLAQIALDESRHAELAWDIDAWLSTVLTAEEREGMARARLEATAELPAFQLAEPWLLEVGLQGQGVLRALRAEFVAVVRA